MIGLLALAAAAALSPNFALPEKVVTIPTGDELSIAVRNQSNAFFRVFFDECDATKLRAMLGARCRNVSRHSRCQGPQCG